MRKLLILLFACGLALAQYTPPSGGSGNAGTVTAVSGPAWFTWANATSTPTATSNVTPVTVGTLPTICTTVALTGQSASITATNLLCNGVQAPAGVYRICDELQTTSGQSGTGAVNALTFTWVPSGSAVSYGIQSVTLTANAVTPSTTSANVTGCKMIHHDGSAHITYATTYSATGQYDLYIVLERLL